MPPGVQFVRLNRGERKKPKALQQPSDLSGWGEASLPIRVVLWNARTTAPLRSEATGLDFMISDEAAQRDASPRL